MLNNKRLMVSSGLSASVALSLLAFPGMAADSHIHGELELQLVQQGETLAVRLSSPLANLVPFEYQPVKAEDKFQLNQVIKQLKKTTWLNTSPTQCAEQEVQVSYSWQLDADVASEQSAHHHADHDHDHDHGAEHSSATLDYQLLCSNGDIDNISVTLFSLLPALERIQAQWISEQGQGAKQLTPTDNSFQLKR